MPARKLEVTADEVFAVLPYRNRTGLRRREIADKLGIDKDDKSGRRLLSNRLMALSHQGKAVSIGTTRAAVWTRA